MPKLLIATPAYGEVFYTPYVQSMFRLHRALGPLNWTLSFASIAYADVAEARNFLLTHWFDKTDASHLLFVDADMGFEAQLIVDMLGLNKPVVGVVAPRRQINLRRLAKLSGEGQNAATAIARSHDFIVRPVQGRAPHRLKGFMEVEGCGAGILLIARNCIETMLGKLPEIDDKRAAKTSPIARNVNRLIRAFDPLTVNGARLSEDFAFCHRWRGTGGEIWARTDKAVTHIGLHRFEARYADASGPHILMERLPQPAIAGRKPGTSGGGGRVRAAGAALAVREGGRASNVIRGKLAPPAKGDKGKNKH